MRVSIHQPHYFPWLGYLDKMAKADMFVILDEVQFEKSSQMIRNRVLDQNGETKYLTISGDTKNFLDRRYCDLCVKEPEIWTKRQMDALRNYYRKSKAKNEIFPLLEQFFSQEYATICQWTCGSIEWTRNILGITTPLLYQSQIDYDRSCKKSDLVYSICNALHADVYFSGRGASVDYLEREKFAEHGVNIVFQDFVHPVYPQISSVSFVPGISILDMLLNCGIEESRRIFWENVHSTHEFE